MTTFARTPRNAAAATVCLLLAGAASAMDYPARKPGLW